MLLQLADFDRCGPGCNGVGVQAVCGKFVQKQGLGMQPAYCGLMN